MDVPRVSLADVARAAEVSVTTASNAYNHPERLSAATRARVLEVAGRLSYQGPNAAARSLRRQRANAIGLLLTEELAYAVVDATASGLVAGIATALDPLGWSLLIIPGRCGPRGDWLQDTGRVLDAVVDGLVLYSLPADDPAVGAARARRLPLVTIDQPRLPGVPHVGIDDRGGARLAAEHLVTLGHRRVAVLSFELRRDGARGPITEQRRRRAASTMALARLDGYEDGLGGAARADLVEVPSNTAVDAQQAVMAVLARRDRPTAVLAMSDTLAQGVLLAAAELGLEVPRDLSVVGFDGRPVASHERAVTTVHQDSAAKGRRATELLLAQIRGEPPRRRAVILDVRLLDRGTSGPPPPAQEPTRLRRGP